MIVQVTVVVRFCMVPSEKIPVAANCNVSPGGSEGGPSRRAPRG